MKEVKEKFDINSDAVSVNKISCTRGNASDFGRSLTYQVGSMFGFSSPLSKVDPSHETEEEIQKLQSMIQSIRWQCYQHLFKYQLENDKEIVETFQNLVVHLNENVDYLDTKYMFDIQRIGMLNGAISMLTSLVVFVIIYFVRY